MTLLVAMIMLILLTLLAMMSFNIGRSSLQIVGNMQSRAQAVNAAQGALELTLSSTRFIKTPQNAIPNPCNGIANTTCASVAGSGRQDITVALTPAPACIAVKAIKNASLDLTQADDAGCAIGASQSFGVAGTSSADSLCSDSVWNLTALATDAVTQTKAVVNQGASVRVAVDDIATSCP
ncbi:MAG: hypothetical protein KGQ77_05695 [Betaproteobacteria bacterium]|nr:hypothetical protein [Betaproteobacteria bacterium]